MHFLWKNHDVLKTNFLTYYVTKSTKETFYLSFYNTIGV